jgi:hypothetical protein
MQGLCIAWLYPAISLVWIGFAPAGLRSSDDAAIAAALNGAQAIAVLLTIFTVLIGGIWALRTWEYLPAGELTSTGRRSIGPFGHAAAAPVVVVATVAAIVIGRGAPLFGAASLLAVISGCYAGLLLPRWLLRAPLDRAFPVAAFSAAMIFQVTIGWLHVLRPRGQLAPLLLVEGLILSWAAIAAARAVSSVGADFAPATSRPPAEIGSVVADSVSRASAVAVAVAAGSVDDAAMAAARADQPAEAAVDLVSQAPALPSLPGPAVGH